MQKELTALALRRAGESTIEALRQKQGGGTDEELLAPYLTGYTLHRVKAGDTLDSIAAMHHTTVRAIETANPVPDAGKLSLGQLLVVPLDFPVVPEDTPMSYALLRYVLRGLEARYPWLRERVIGRSGQGRKLYQLRIGTGPRIVYYNAAHHANEWITTPAVLSCLEYLLEARSRGVRLLNLDPEELLAAVTLYLVPMVNPDGVDLVVGAATEKEYRAAETIAQGYPEIPFPEGWKADLQGVDLNLNYPARWDEAREIKAQLGFTAPAPRDYVGLEPLSQPETLAMFQTTENLDPALTIAWHTQGQEIYWRFLDLEPDGARALGEQMAAASGYRLEESAYNSSFAGYKDWFIQDFDRPGYTIEAGIGENPLPLTQLPEIVRDNLPIFLLGLTGPQGEENLVPAGSVQPAVRPSREPPQVRTLPRGDGMEMSWG